MDGLIILGLIAGALSTISFLPQVIQIIKTKDTKAISLPMYIIFCFAIVLWLVYAVFKKDIPVLLTNLLIGIQAFTILVMKIKYK